MTKNWHAPLLVLFVLAIGSIVYFFWIKSGSFPACGQAELSENDQKTIEVLDSIVELGLTLATALVGFGAALLIGLKTGLSSSPATRALVGAAVLLFAQSILYAVWWREGIAEVFLNKCFNMIVSDRIQWRFDAHLNLFMVGLFALAVLVIQGMFASKKESET